ncbi:MAG: acetylxylan esterase [Verrucomicrobiae bacterium]|nr:acetylxylan esterase [Verrucomicrobiae bacterium]
MKSSTPRYPNSLLVAAVAAVTFGATHARAQQGKVADSTGLKDAKVVVEIGAENPAARREVGETVSFTVSVSQGGQPLDVGSVIYTLSDDAFAPIEKESLALMGKPLTILGKLERPGFLRCEVQVTQPDGRAIDDAKAVAAAAVAPEQISPSREAPHDFDDFWSEQKQRLAEVPLEAELVRVQKVDNRMVDGGVELYDIKVRTETEWPVSGYFARPKEAKAKSLPAVLWVHGAGVRSSTASKAISGAREGYLSLDINAHGIENGKPEAFYKALESDEGRLRDYRYQGRENRDGMYFRGMFTRLVRAIDFLTAQPEWDGRVMAVIGHSQGGGQALVAGGLDDRVTFVGAGVPALCDHTGMLRRRIAGWPKLVPILPDGKPDPTVAEVSRYFDAVNFAARCHADAIVSVGFIDRTCPPTSCYAAFNQLKGEVEILTEPTMGHAAPREIVDAFWEALKRHTEKRHAEGALETAEVAP